MKVMVCIPVEISVDTTRRKEIREAVRNRLASGFMPTLLDALDSDTFVVRAPEAGK